MSLLLQLEVSNEARPSFGITCDNAAMNVCRIFKSSIPQIAVKY